MNPEIINKDNNLYQSYQGEVKKLEKEELINSQLDKSKKNNNNDEGKPIHNYPYEFYEENKIQIELKQNDITKDEPKLKEIKEIIKEEFQAVKINPENIEKNVEKEKKEINNNENIEIKLENKDMKEEEKKNIEEPEKKIIEEHVEKEIKEPIKNVINEEKNVIVEPEKKEIKEPIKEIIAEEKNVKLEPEKKDIQEEVKKVIKESEKEAVKEPEKKDIIKPEKKEIKEEKKIIKKEIKPIKEEKKPIKEEKKPIKEEKKSIKEEKRKIKEEKKDMKKEERKPIKEEKKVIKKEEKKPIKEEKKIIKKEEKKINKEKEKKIVKEEEKIEKKDIIEKFRNSPKKDDKIRKIILKNMDKKDLEAPLPPREEHIPPKVKTLKMSQGGKVNKNIQDKKPLNQFQKSTLTKQTEDNYNLMIQQLKNKDYKTSEDHVIKNIINSDDKISIGENNNKIENSKRKELIEDFLQRNQDEIKNRQNNKLTINDRLKIADENSKKRMYFNNTEDEQDYFDEFYNKQMQFKNDQQINIDRLTQQLNEEKQKNYIPEKKNKTDLNYFKNNCAVELSKYQKDNKIKTDNKKENTKENKKENENPKNSTPQLRSKKPSNNIINKPNNSGKESLTKLKETKNENISNKNKLKKSKKEIDELTNKLHYEGELLKVKKQTKISEAIASNPNFHNFSKEKLSRSSLIILIKKFLYEYSTSVKNNTFIDCIKNPKLNYDQYIDILKDLYYLEKEALPEEYLEDDTMYKELWDKLTKFSKGPENSIESNVLLLYFLELNGFFRNEKLIKELETEIHWIKLEDYEELIANAKFIEENWDDLKMKKIENIKRLKSLKQYNPIHNEEIYNNNTVNSNTNLNMNSINVNDSNHYITIIKGNTNYELIHGYTTKKKNGEHDSFSELLDDKKGITNYNSLTMSNNMTKNNKNRITLQEGYNEIILKKKTDIENIKQKEEKKLKEECTFKPALTTMSKKMFNNNTKVDLPKYRLNKSVNIYSGDNKNKTHKNSKSTFGKDEKSTNTMKLRKNKSNLQKMFDNNPLKDDKIVNERVQILKNVKSNEINDDNYMIIPMRFNIDYPSKFEGIGVSISRDSNIRQFAPNIIFYNIKINDKIRTLKYIEGDDLKLNVINFVRKNKLPEEVVNIILKKIKEKELEEKMNNQC